MSDDDIVRSMRGASDEELLAITSHAEMGYTERAREIAEAVLRERRVPLPFDLRELRKRGAMAEAADNRRNADLAATRDQSVGRRLGFHLVILGVGGFVLPLFGFQFKVLMSLEWWAIPIAAAIAGGVGLIFLVRTTPNQSRTPPARD